MPGGCCKEKGKLPLKLSHSTKRPRRRKNKFTCMFIKYWSHLAGASAGASLQVDSIEKNSGTSCSEPSCAKCKEPPWRSWQSQLIQHAQFSFPGQFLYSLSMLFILLNYNIFSYLKSATPSIIREFPTKRGPWSKRFITSIVANGMTQKRPSIKSRWVRVKGPT